MTTVQEAITNLLEVKDYIFGLVDKDTSENDIIITTANIIKLRRVYDYLLSIKEEQVIIDKLDKKVNDLINEINSEDIELDDDYLDSLIEYYTENYDIINFVESYKEAMDDEKK